MNTGGTCTPHSVNYSQDNFDRYRVYTSLATGVDDHPGIHAFTPTYVEVSEGMVYMYYYILKMNNEVGMLLPKKS